VRREWETDLSSWKCIDCYACGECHGVWIFEFSVFFFDCYKWDVLGECNDAPSQRSTV
jgi:hypothetical protein